MKKLLLAFIATALLVCGCNKTKQFKVGLNLDNADNQTVYLYKDADVKHVFVDSAVIVGNTAELKADFDDPQTCYIIKFNKSEYETCGDNFEFFTENQNTTIAGEYGDMPHWTVTGCPTMNAINAYHQESLKQYEDPIMALCTEIIEAGKVDDTLKMVELNEQLQPLMEAYTNNEIEFIRSHSDDYLGPYMLYLAKEGIEDETVKELVEGFTTESVYIQKVKDYLQEVNPQ
jgi:hypothetical protein